MTLYYKQIGDKKNETILFIHGFLGTHKDWLPIAQAFSSDYHCILIDLPGHGISSDPNEEPSFDTTGLSIKEILKTLDIVKVHLIGYSLGGRVALCFSSLFPDYIQSLTLESAHPGLKTEKEKEERYKFDKKWSELLKSVSMKEFLRLWYSQPLFNTLCQHKNFPLLLKQRETQNTIALSKALTELSLVKQPNLWPHFTTLTSPLLLITGSEDKKYNSLFTEIHNSHAKSTLVIMKKSGHNTHFERKDTFIETIKNKCLNNSQN